MNTIDLSRQSVEELIQMAKGWVDDCEALTRLCNAEYLEEPTQEDKERQAYDEGEVHYISILSGLKASLTSAAVLSWLKKCEENKKEWTAKFASSLLELDSLKASFWKRKLNQAQVQYTKTEILHRAMVEFKPKDYSLSFGSTPENKKVMTTAAAQEMMEYLKD
tara:strand:+ start:638 stop:1129 length:492 start_codon:yes stop_codon:yes gene_type:complete